MSYKHITPEQRNELAVLLRAGHNQKEIAELLKKEALLGKSTVTFNPKSSLLF